MRLSRVPLFVFVSLALISASAVNAQTPPPSAADAADTDTSVPVTATETVTVTGTAGTAVSTTGTKTPTPLRDVPQAISVVTGSQMRDAAMQGIADVVRYVPGVGVAQGESNRDAPVLRGTTSTGDFFVDGVRDDAQYFRDLYNVERIEVLKGPNAMIFGRGGVGGVVNRVSKRADWTRVRELSVQGGSWSNRRFTADIGDALGSRAAFRVAGVFEDSDSYRRGVTLERQGVTPALSFGLGSRTMIQTAVEYFHDRRTADRGVPSLNGRPVAVDPSTFFGNADDSFAEATVNAASVAVEHLFDHDLLLRSRTQLASYAKFYQNVFPGAVNATAATVSVSGYNHQTDRGNIFNQTDLTATRQFAGVRHRLAAGAEFGRQSSNSFRQTAFFTAVSPSTTTLNLPLDNPITTEAMAFRQSPTDADTDSTAAIAAVYLQDQVQLARFLEVVAGVRYDRFEVVATNNRTADAYRSVNNLVSPRLGVVVKPHEDVSLYSSFTRAYQPRAGEQLTSLTLSNRTLEPETFRNLEAGAKWDLGAVALTAALYRLDRGNVAITNPADPTTMILVDGQRMKGLELGAAGAMTSAWTVMGGYAWQRGTVLTTQSATVRAGNVMGQVPAHSFSLWNRVNVTPVMGVGLGVIHRGDLFVAADDAVVLPRFTRVDAALFIAATRQVRVQANVENVLDTRYFASAHSNNNITPGSPRALRITLTTGF
jgi:catecholate siderophore receptor